MSASDHAPTGIIGTSSVNRSRRFAAFLLIVVVLYAAGLNPYWRFQRDSALYMSLARSLAQTGRYAYENQPHVFVLPGFPAMLSLVYMALGESFLVMNALVSALGVGCVALACALFARMGLTDRQLTACAVLFGLSRTLYYYSSHIMADVPFTFFVVLALYCGVRMLGAKGRSGWGWCAAAGAAVCAATFVRPLGPALLVALVAAAWLRPGGWADRRANLARTALLAVPTLALAGAWIVRCALVPAGDQQTYYGLFIGQRSLSALVTGMMGHIPHLVSSLADGVLGVDLELAGGIVLLLMMAPGLATALRRGERLLCLFGLAYLTAVCLGTPGRRYLLPVLPVMAYWLVLGAGCIGEFLSGRLPPRRLLATGTALLCLAVGVNVLRIGKVVQQARSSDFYAAISEGVLPDYFRLARWLKENAAPGDVLWAREDRFLYYFAQVPTWSPAYVPPAGRQRRLLAALQRRGVSYMVLDPGEDKLAWRVAELAASRPDVFEKAATFGRLELYRVHGDRLGMERP